MRTLPHVNVCRSIENLFGIVRQVQFLQIRSLVFFLALTAMLSMTVSVLGEDEEDPPAPQKPEIINFSVLWDGHDQFYLSGQVVGVDNPDGLTVVFGDYATGYTAETGFGGYFGTMLIFSHGEHETYSATVTSHEGIESDRVCDWVW